MPTPPTGGTACAPTTPTVVYSRILKELFPRHAGHHRRHRGFDATASPTTTTGRTNCCRAFWPSVPPTCSSTAWASGPSSRLPRRLQQGEDHRPPHRHTAGRPPYSRAPIPPRQSRTSTTSCWLRTRSVCNTSASRPRTSATSRRSRTSTTPSDCGSAWASGVIVVNPPYPPMTEAEIDASFDLPYTRMPHPPLQGEDDTGLRDDQVFGQSAPGLFRRVRLLHPSRPIRANSSPRVPRSRFSRR